MWVSLKTACIQLFLEDNCEGLQNHKTSAQWKDNREGVVHTVLEKDNTCITTVVQCNSNCTFHFLQAIWTPSQMMTQI